MKAAADIIRPKPAMSMWDWNCQYVDFSLDHNYKAASPGQYDPSLMPWWKGIVDAIDNPRIKEVVVLGISQGGKEEHCLCFPARYWAGTNRRLRILYVGHQETLSEEIYIDRVKGGMKITQPTINLLGTVKERGMQYSIGATQFGCTHGGTGGGLKGKPWDVVLCSEVSSFKSVAVLDEARKRGITRPFFKLVMWGCPDWRQARPSDEDPLFVEYDMTDQREWTMPDPKTGNPFFWQVGDGKADGIYWDRSAKRNDGSYDLDLVERTAHYVTPDGTVITEDDRWRVVCSGSWQSTNKDAPSFKFGAHVNQMMLKWKDVGGFGHIARRYLESYSKGPFSYRAFRYEVEAAKWYGEKETIEVNSIEQRKAAYRAGQHLSTIPAYSHIAIKRSMTLMTIDVQKSKLYCLIREWYDGGDSALVEWAELTTWKDVAMLAAKHSVARSFIDTGYTERRNEVLEQCLFGDLRGGVPMFGRDGLKEAYKVDKRDPFEGTGKQGRSKLPMVTFNPDQIKHILAGLTAGTDSHVWMLPTDIDAEYIMQVTSEERIDGAWVKRRRDNHLWDCEVMSLCAAMILGVFRQVAIDLDAPVIQSTTPAAATITRRTGVYMPD